MPEPRFGTGTLRTVYLGQPGSMEKLVVPNSGVTMPISQASVAHTAINGGVSYTRGGDGRRTYGYAWGAQTPDDADPILGFYLGTRGPGPFCLIDPAFRNQMGLDVSTFGKRFNLPTNTPGWNTTNGTLTSDTGEIPFSPGSGPAVWLGLTANATLFEGAVGSVDSAPWYIPDATTETTNGTAIPYIADQPHCLSIYVRVRDADQTCTVRWRALGLLGSGGNGSIDGATGIIPVTTSWQRLWVTVYPASSYGFSPSATPYVCSALTVVDPGSAAANGIEVSNAQHEIGVTRPSPWVTGVGVPRVLIGDPNQVGATLWDRRDQSLVLTEM